MRIDRDKVLEQEKLRSIAEHPCYNPAAHQYARMHMPVAPACNISCNYCNRKFDCMNESRPGVTSEVLSAEQARDRFLAVKSKLSNLRVVGIAGPGDALAEFEKTKAAIELIKASDPDITICLSTNGLLLPDYADELMAMGIKHITVTMNAVDPAIGEKIYGSIHYRGKTYKNGSGAALLLENQLKGIRRVANAGAVVKVNIVMIKGINDHHIPEVVKTAKDCGAFITNIMPLIPVEGTPFETIGEMPMKELNAMRTQCGETLRQMYHCRQCRADAIGMLKEDISLEFRGMPCKAEPLEKKADKGVI